MKYLDHIQYEMPYEVMKAQSLNVYEGRVGGCVRHSLHGRTHVKLMPIMMIMIVVVVMMMIE